MVNDIGEKNVKDGMNPVPSKATPLQIGLALIILGSSAGMTLYTKKTSAVLGHMDRMKRNKNIRMPTKYGPPTKKEWEKLRPRW